MFNQDSFFKWYAIGFCTFNMYKLEMSGCLFMLLLYFLITTVIRHMKRPTFSLLCLPYRYGAEARNGMRPGCVNSAFFKDKLYGHTMTKHQVHIICKLTSGEILCWFSKVEVIQCSISEGISFFCRSGNYAIMEGSVSLDGSLNQRQQTLAWSLTEHRH